MEALALRLGPDPQHWNDRQLIEAVTDGCPPLAEPCLPRPGQTTAELVAIHGWPEATACRLMAVLELGRRALLQGPREVFRFQNGEQVYQYLAPRLGAERVECFYALYLDAKGALVAERRISQGTLTSSLVHPREVFAPALLHRCAALVVAHNHPSGDPEPSAQDRATTRRLIRAGKLLGLDVLDHVILGEGRYFSFLEQGILGIS